MSTPHILAVNIGSSSLKFALYAFDAPHPDLDPTGFSGNYEGLAPGSEPQLRMTQHGQSQTTPLADVNDAPMAAALQDLQARIAARADSFLGV